jgi:2-oxoisovalerate dehydrogenase E1 component
MKDELIRESLLIRRVEETFLKLFSKGKLNGTVHTCVGQEFSAVSFAGQLTKDDYIFSNHRCHGHFISFTKDIYGLIAELLGKEKGVCGGIGSSQHLCKNNFFSNGIQGGIVPIAAGIALANKLKHNDCICTAFIGDGTLGQGVIYETMNIVSKWHIPLLIVCENNSYAQSTHKDINLAGDILKRAESFGIQTFQNDTWNYEKLFHDSKTSISYVRNKKRPVFHLIDTYRLNPHSKGDDFRNKKEINKYYTIDPLNLFKNKEPDKYRLFLEEIDMKINRILKDLDNSSEMSITDYCNSSESVISDNRINWIPLEEINVRQVDLINQFFEEVMASDKRVLLVGEDILSPYGGPFKAAKNLSDIFPEQVFTTPISEAAITGISNGLAIAGMRPFLEIMFGDFITLSFDQIVNHASKFYHMYNKQVTCPVVIRTPMGGRRGYGPTHSQTLDKFLTGIDNVSTIALNSLINPKQIYKTIYEKENHPVIVIENKTDYGKKIAKNRIKNYKYLFSTHTYPLIKIFPLTSKPTATIVTYGGMVDIVLNAVYDLFTELEILPELIVLTRIHPLDYNEIINSVKITKRLFVIEEGSYFGGIGSEVISNVTEIINDKFIARRIAALPVPIPSVKSLEEQVLPNKQIIIEKIRESLT